MVPYHPLCRIQLESIQKCYHIQSSNITELYPCFIIIHHKRYNDTKISLPKMCESLRIINYGLIKKINADYATLPRFDSIYLSLGDNMALPMEFLNIITQKTNAPVRTLNEVKK